MNRFSPKQTLSNIATAVRESVNFVNKKSFAVATATFMISSAIAFSDSTAFSGAEGTWDAPAPAAVKINKNAGAVGGVPVKAGVSSPQRAPAAAAKKPAPVANATTADSSVPKPAKIELSGAQSSPSAISNIQTENPSQTSRKYTEERCAALGEASAWCISARKNLDSVMFPNMNRENAQCAKLDDRITELGTRAEENCTNAGVSGDLVSCFDTVTACKDADREADDFDPEDEPSEQEYCNKLLANRCPGLPRFDLGHDYAREKKEAETDRKDAKKIVDELMDDQRKAQQDQYKEQREMQEQQQNAAFNARQQEIEIANNLKKALEGVSEDQKRAFEDAKKTVTEMDVEYIKMRREARAAADAVEEAKDDLQAMCRSSAEKKYAEAEKQRLALQQKNANRNAGTAVSGSSKRAKTAAARARAIDYAAMLNECLNGSTADGVGGRNRIATRKRAQDSAEKFMADQSAIIEKKRAEMIAALQGMEQEATNKQAKIVEEINQQRQQLSEKQALVAQQNQARIAENQRISANESQSIQQKLNAANQELMDTQRESSLAQKRQTCAGKSGRRSDNSREKMYKGFGNSISEITQLAQMCSRRPVICETEADKQLADTPAICVFASKAVDQSPKDKARERRRKSIKGLGITDK